MSYLFHKDVFMPKSVSAPCYEGFLRYSAHALLESQTDRFGKMVLPETFSAVNAELIESEIDEETHKVMKQVWRQSLDAERDLVLVLTADGYVKTVWINKTGDNHPTLRKNMYFRP